MKPQHITVDEVQKEKKKQFSSPHLSMVAAIYQVYMYACRWNLNHTFGYQLTLNINEGIRSHRVENTLYCNGLLGIRQKVGLL